MHCKMGKHWSLLFKCFASRLTKLNNYLPLLPGLSEVKNIFPEERNEILLHAIPNGWVKQSYLQEWYYEGKTYKDTWEMIGRI